jgi:hypothetical protein
MEIRKGVVYQLGTYIAYVEIDGVKKQDRFSTEEEADKWVADQLPKPPVVKKVVRKRKTTKKK